MNRFISQKFRFFTFTSIALLLFVHGYNLQTSYLTPHSQVSEPLTLTTFLEYLIANGLLRFRLAMLFLISGYIFALQDEKPFLPRIRHRLNTLIVPFLIWSAWGLAVTFVLQLIPFTAVAVKAAHLDQLGDNRPYWQIGWAGVLYRWIVKPVSFQLWFIRSLFIYNLLYPVIKWAVLKYPVIWFSLVVIFWHTIFNFYFIEGQGLFFFSLGVFLLKTKYPIAKRPTWFKPFIAWLFYIGIAVIKTFLALELEPNSPYAYFVLFGLHEVCVVAGILSMWFTLDPFIKWIMEKPWFLWLTSFSFFCMPAMYL